MDTEVIVALIAALASLALTGANIYWSWRQRDKERRIEAKAELARYRKPLLEAAADLGARIDNIQHSHFDAYFQSDDRRDMAIKSTLYRFARYFATLEILRSQLTFLEFERASETKEVAAQIVKIEGALTSDNFDEFMPGGRSNEQSGRQPSITTRTGSPAASASRPSSKNSTGGRRNGSSASKQTWKKTARQQAASAWQKCSPTSKPWSNSSTRRSATSNPTRHPPGWGARPGDSQTPNRRVWLDAPTPPPEKAG